MDHVAIFIPTYKRPHNLERVVTNIHENTRYPNEIYFIIEGNDPASGEELTRLKQRFFINLGEPCFADAINTAYTATTEPFFFVGADDLGFHENWLPRAMKEMQDETVGVVGTNDLGNPDVLNQQHATHFLVRRSYIEKHSGRIDKRNVVFYPYKHNYCDTEFIETAKSRNAFKPCLESVVEHLHPVWGKGNWDETYNIALQADANDRKTFNQRQQLWQT